MQQCSRVQFESLQRRPWNLKQTPLVHVLRREEIPEFRAIRRLDRTTRSHLCFCSVRLCCLVFLCLCLFPWAWLSPSSPALGEPTVGCGHRPKERPSIFAGIPLVVTGGPLRCVVHCRAAHRGYPVLGTCTLFAGTVFGLSSLETGRGGAASRFHLSR